MAKKSDEEQYYSQLARNKTMQYGFNVLFIGVYAGLVLFIFSSLVLNTSWTNLIIPILLLNLPIIFFPLIEHWTYKPWQAKARKYEIHYED